MLNSQGIGFQGANFPNDGAMAEGDLAPAVQGSNRLIMAKVGPMRAPWQGMAGLSQEQGLRLTAGGQGLVS